jgi:O-antigen ligase
VAVVLAVAILHVFELDRFFVPKELVLHTAVLLAALFALRATVALAWRRVDTLLMLFLGLSALSALFATNQWLALRALCITASSILLFWVTRALSERGLAHPLRVAFGFGIVLVAITALLQTYGLDVDFFSENRAPGGTLGNRNFVAHAAAFGAPLLLFITLRARRGAMFFWSATGFALVTAALVLTRSRAAWLAFAAAIVFFKLLVLFAPAARRDGVMWRRLVAIVFFCAVAVGAALLLPNTLHWNSNNPYLESVRRVTDYESGSGHGRLIQYEHSLAMALHNPIFGVGPGNWPVEYPDHAARHDPSLDDNEPGMTSNPWPSSDWVAYVSERGVIATFFLAAAFLSMILLAFRKARAAVDAVGALEAITLFATVTAALVAGLFDAVLLLALPAYLVWGTLGLFFPNDELAESPKPGRRRMALLFLVPLCAAGALRSGLQLAAMNLYATSGDRASLLTAAQLDPGNYRVHLRLGRILRSHEQRCHHLRAAHRLYPNASAARPCT